MFETRFNNLNWLKDFSRKIRLDKPLFYFSIYILERFFPSELMKREKKFYIENEDKIKFILDGLCDEKSKNVYKACLSYRSDRKEYLNKFMDKSEEQYFSPDIVELNNEYFVDCGAYIGDTLAQFLKYSNLKNISGGGYFAFEPDENNLKELNKYNWIFL